jgi:hypothetical protein
MWYALTANSVIRDKKEMRKEFYANPNEIVVTAESRDMLEQKLNECLHLYPQQAAKYLRAGIKIVEADSIKMAKRKARDTFTYFNHTGQYSIF